MKKDWSKRFSAVVPAVLMIYWVGVQCSADDGEAHSVGTIRWEISDGANSKLLWSGERILHKEDIDVWLRNHQTVKRIALDDHFYIGLNDPVDLDKTSIEEGFALTGNRRDEKSFSWEWFIVDHAGHATKLQESGEVSFSTAKTRNGTEIDHIEFLTDVSIRLVRTTDSASGLAWRIKILKGSSISWPAIPQRWPDGQARLNRKDSPGFCSGAAWRVHCDRIL